MQTAVTQTRADVQASQDHLELLRALPIISDLDAWMPAHVWLTVVIYVELGCCRYEHCAAAPPKHASTVLQVKNCWEVARLCQECRPYLNVGVVVAIEPTTSGLVTVRRTRSPRQQIVLEN